jgi:4-hydroxy-tetrahydrodipicolinate synthase
MNVLTMTPRGRMLTGGSATALPTPFQEDRIDRESLAQLCERQIDRGTTTLVVCGSTGEAASLRPEEYRLAIQVVVEAAGGRVPVMAGCGALSTAGAAELATIAAQSGAAALLCAPTPYVKPTQEGIVGYVTAVRNASGLPIMMYDVPGRTGVSVANATLARLFERGLIVGLKDATADLARPTRMRALCGSGFLQMSGDDATAAAYRAAGGDGCVSVTANVAPGLCSLMHRSWDNGDLSTFANVRDWLAEVNDLLFIESNPIPLKAALFEVGLVEADVRLPLTPASRETYQRLAEPIAALTAMEEALVARRGLALVG